jgi:hypothetical protein
LAATATATAGGGRALSLFFIAYTLFRAVLYSGMKSEYRINQSPYPGRRRCAADGLWL